MKGYWVNIKVSGTVTLIRRWSSLGREVVTRLLHDFGYTQLIHLWHGKHLHTQQLQDVTGSIKEKQVLYSKDTKYPHQKSTVTKILLKLNELVLNVDLLCPPTFENSLTDFRWAQKPTALLGPRLSNRCRPDLWPTRTAWSRRSLARPESGDTRTGIQSITSGLRDAKIQIVK